MVDHGALDLLDTEDLVDAIVTAQAHVVAVVRAAGPAIAAAAELLVTAYERGGRILLLGAGTSGRLAVMEAAEVPGTFGVPAERIVARVAGGSAEQLIGTDGAEDDTALAQRDMTDLSASEPDVLVAVAASGTTPYTLTAAEIARARGAPVVAVTNRPESPLAGAADVAVTLPVGVEVLSGSTRLAAGTAQKIALNALTTAAMVRLGRVHDRYMVDVVAANEKLVQRLTTIVAACTDASQATAEEALQRCDGNGRAAIVHLATGLPPDAAARHAAAHRTVRAAVEAGLTAAGARRR
ncbi:N-acetylmuramic acid 6-phosphate etherase [Pseudonocardia acidicola]|uniref:N-acetylmuramic acid 6-phosphate etherase n=1 Tax=Pseudonocardia acidicola TaxID=2724939 RepID=A0ABX1S773_9PSEU|nr:N-acetylmuramic acid 6-phosphate etherase [Pseudonocardia acidicola]